MHKAKGIIDAIVAKLTALTPTTITSVIRNQSYPATILPAVSISMGEDEPINQQLLQDWELVINTDIHIAAQQEDVDTETLLIRSSIHQALINDQTLGLNYVSDIKCAGQQEPVLQGDGEKTVSSTRLRWLVRYRANIGNPEI